MNVLSFRRVLVGCAGIAAALVSAVGCGGEDLVAVQSAETQSSASNQSADVDAAAGIRLVSPQDGASMQADPPEGLVVLDVRTPDEFAEARLDGAIMIDFYEDDFATQLAELDPNASYLLYCRSGNRSGQTALLMEELGFTDVADVDGGIVAWNAAGLPTVSG